jgi:hypothetical protein
VSTGGEADGGISTGNAGRTVKGSWGGVVLTAGAIAGASKTSAAGPAAMGGVRRVLACLGGGVSGGDIGHESQQSGKRLSRCKALPVSCNSGCFTPSISASWQCSRVASGGPLAVEKPPEKKKTPQGWLSRP